MLAGLERSDVAYVWPAMLAAPPANVRLVYLDLNHWIGLAKANVGHPDGARFQHELEFLRAAKRTGSYVFPLSSTHYMEVSSIADPRQRFDIAEVMEELSDFAGLMSRTVVMHLEVEAALDAMGYARAEAYATVPLLCQGALQMLGRQGGLRVRNASGEDITEYARLAWKGGPEAFDQWQRDGELLLERSLLRGPTDAEVPDLRAEGWDPVAARQVAIKRATEEREQADRLTAEPRWRRGRLRDVVSARYLFIELHEILADALSARGAELKDVFPAPEVSRRFMDSMPSADVSVTLATAAHKNPQTKWTPNDIFDIDALGLAVPYCDFVVTERHARHALQVSKLDQRCGTQVLATLAELVAALSDSPAAAAERSKRM